MRRIAILLLIGTGSLTAVTGVAGAERTQEGNLTVSLDAEISPHSLPRTGEAPASVRLATSFSTSDGSRLPRLRTMAVVLGASGQFDTGLPVCPTASITNTTAAQALRACGPALVGHGRMEAEAILPGQRAIRFDGRVLAFNGIAKDGTPSIIADVHSKSPPASFLMPFSLRQVHGTSTTGLVAHLPAAAGRWTHVRSFELTLGRRFERGGRMHSYVNAACPAPAGLRGLIFTFAEATFGFSGGREVSVAAVRGCRVRGPR